MSNIPPLRLDFWDVHKDAGILLDVYSRIKDSLTAQERDDMMDVIDHLQDAQQFALIEALEVFDGSNP